MGGKKDNMSALFDDVCDHIIVEKVCQTMLQVAQWVKCQTPEVEVWGLKPFLGTCWWGPIPPDQSYPNSAAAAATTLLAEG